MRGIAAVLYESQGKTVFSVTGLNSKSAEDIFVERSHRAEIRPNNNEDARAAFAMAFDELRSQEQQVYSLPSRQMVQFPTAIVYGVPEVHPEELYKSLLLNTFPNHFHGKRKKMMSRTVNGLMKNLFLSYHRMHGCSGSIIELKDYYLFLPEGVISPESPVISGAEKQGNELLNNLHTNAMIGDNKSLEALRKIAGDVANTYAQDIKRRGIEIPRFVLYGPRNEAQKENIRYTFLNWHDLKDVFVRELVTYMKDPHNVCVKTPIDEASPPFADICATQLADYWDILADNHTKRNVFAKKVNAFSVY